MPKYSIITRTTGIEPALLGVTGQYFNRLSYVLEKMMCTVKGNSAL